MYLLRLYSSPSKIAILHGMDYNEVLDKFSEPYIIVIRSLVKLICRWSRGKCSCEWPDKAFCKK